MAEDEAELRRRIAELADQINAAYVRHQVEMQALRDQIRTDLQEALEALRSGT